MHLEQDVGQVRLYKGAEGGALPPLSDFGSQRGRTVRLFRQLDLDESPSNPWGRPTDAHSVQVVPHARIPDDEEEQPAHPNYDPRGIGSRTESLGEIRSVAAAKRGHDWARGKQLTLTTEFGREKVESLAGMDDKAIENKVTELVKTGI